MIKHQIKSLLQKTSPSLYIMVQQILHKDIVTLNKKKFLSVLRQIEARIKESCPTVQDNQPPIVLLVTPWLRTAIPYQFLLWAYLYRLQGRDVLVLWNDLVDEFEGKTEIEQFEIKSVVKELTGSVVPLRRLSEFTSNTNDMDMPMDQLHRESVSMVIHQVRSAFILREHQDLTDRYMNGLLRDFPYVRKFAETYQGSRVVVPGGICGNTSLFYHFQKKPWNLRISSLDTCCSGNSRPATHKDCFFAFQKYATALDDVQKKRIEGMGEHLFHERVHGIDDITGNGPIQRSAFREDLHYDVVIVPNVEWDSAALNIEDVFSTASEWLQTTLDYLLENTNYRIALRQHPAEQEVIELFKYPNYLAEFLKERYSEYPRFTFFSAEDDVNTYSLIKNAKVILPWTSDIAVDAAVMGKISVVHTHAYYQDEPYVKRCHSVDEYLRTICEVINSREENVYLAEAKMAYFLHYQFSALYPHLGKEKKYDCFDSIMEGFNHYLEKPLEDICRDEMLTMLLDGWYNDEDFVLLRLQKEGILQS